MKIVDSAIEYRKKGFSTIPMSPANKRPLVKWTEFQNRLPTETEIQSWWKKHPTAMCGIVTGKLSNVTVIDADSPGAISRIEEALPDSIEIPCVKTPRDGQHFYFAYDPSIPTRAGAIQHIDTRSDGGCIVCPPSINDKGGAYSWVDMELSRENLQEMPEPLSQRLSQICAPQSAPYNNKNNIICEGGGGFVDTFVDTSPLFSEGRRDNDLFHLANSLVKSGMPECEIFKYLEFIMHSWGEQDGSWINSKIQSALKQNIKREKSLSEEIREYVLSTKGVFLSTAVHKNLDLSTRVHKKNCSEVLRRLVSEKVIERIGQKDGHFRLIEKNFELLDLSQTEIPPLDLKWPFAIEEMVYCLPKTIAIAGGTPNSGKTAFSLNFARMNMGTFKVRYLSSEMGFAEIKNRLSKFEMPLTDWAGVEFIERSQNYADLILPDAITIIDFLEISDNFYQIAEQIKKIFDSLTTGMVLIAIQKNSGQEWGRGGSFSAEKARLYLTMENGTIRIAKAKNWVSDKNPNGLELDFKLMGGARFLPITGWRDVHQFIAKKTKS